KVKRKVNTRKMKKEQLKGIMSIEEKVKKYVKEVLPKAREKYLNAYYKYGSEDLTGQFCRGMEHGTLACINDLSIILGLCNVCGKEVKNGNIFCNECDIEL